MFESETSSIMSDSLWPHGCSLPGSSVHGILQARVMDWVAIPFSRRYSWPRDQTWVSCIEGRLFTVLATRKAQFMYVCVCIYIYTHTRNCFKESYMCDMLYKISKTSLLLSWEMKNYLGRNRFLELSVFFKCW